MKKVSLLFVCFALACAGANARSLLERLGERAKNATENNIGNKVEKGVNDLLNGKGRKDKKKDNQDNKGEEKQSVQQAASSQKASVNTAYAKSDFVPGDEIIFDDSLDGEQMGELPSTWELLGGEAQVMEINGKKCIALQHDGDCISPLMNSPRNFLGDVFTVEFTKNK